jgi:hypothetical protein
MSDQPANLVVAYCRACGKALTAQTQRVSGGVAYCEEHAPAAAAAPPPPQPGWTPPPAADSSVSPGLAFLLGLIPGVGAIYNGQYAKGLVHMIVFGMVISILDSDAAGSFRPLFGMLAPGWVAYMAFEAYHTARKRLRGEPVDEFSSLVPLRGSNDFPVIPVLLIAFGTIFLLHNLDILRLYQILRYWPVFLIALGVYMLYARISGAPAEPREEAGNER